jgi:hypothetical protein
MCADMGGVWSRGRVLHAPLMERSGRRRAGRGLVRCSYESVPLLDPPFPLAPLHPCSMYRHRAAIATADGGNTLCSR